MAEANEAAAVGAPLEGNTASRTVTSSAVTVYQIPPAFAGQWTRFFAKDAEMQIVFGDSSATVTYNQTSTAATTVLTLSDATGMPVAANTGEHFKAPESTEATHFAVLAEGAGQWFWTKNPGKY